MPLTVVPMLALLLGLVLLLGWMVRHRRAADIAAYADRAPAVPVAADESEAAAPAPVRGVLPTVELGIPPWEVAAAAEAAAARAAMVVPEPVVEPVIEPVIEPAATVSLAKVEDVPVVADTSDLPPIFEPPIFELPAFELPAFESPAFESPALDLTPTPEVEPLFLDSYDGLDDLATADLAQAEFAQALVAEVASGEPFGNPFAVAYANPADDTTEVPVLQTHVEAVLEAVVETDVRAPAEFAAAAEFAPPAWTAPAPAALDPARQVDHTAHAYAELSRSLARAGRLREATLAQWAADLRVLGPLLAGRNDELCHALAGLAPADAGMAIAGARAVASSLVGPSIAVTAMLQDASHLSAHERSSGRPGRSDYAAADVAADVLPDSLVHALGAVLQDSAAQGGDTVGVSVGLRCDLVAHVANDPSLAGVGADEVSGAVRDLLEPHERSRFDAAVVGTGWAS